MSRIIILVLISAVLVLTGCSSSGGGNSSSAGSGVADGAISVMDFKSKMDEMSNEQLIDLRTHGELHSIGPLAGAQNLDYNAGRLNGALSSLNKEAPVMVYCASGGRSAKAYTLLKQFGFKEVYDMEGGIRAWQQAGYPTEHHTH